MSESVTTPLSNGQVEYMDTSDSPWSWYYMADCGRWHRFEDDPDKPLQSEEIERYFLINSKGTLRISSSSGHSTIDFSAMLQINTDTGRQRRIQRSFNVERSCSCFSAPPVFWETLDPTHPYQLIPLNEASPEYQTVAHYVKQEGLLDRSILSISRIQNLDLWEIYCRKKRHLMRIQGVKDIKERRLFHGTKMENVDSICKYNFDLRLVGRCHTYGKGIYFARHASFADKYSDSSTDPLPLYGRDTQVQPGQRTKIMFLARMMIGRYTVGQEDYNTPDGRKIDRFFDSCVDDINNPNIFVIFDPNQIYPEYLIQYR